MTCDEDEVCLLDVLDPVEKQLPEGIDALGDEAFTFKCNLLDLGTVATRFGPVFDGCGGSIGEAYRCTRRLAKHLLNDGSREEAVHTDSDGFLNPWRCWVDVQMRHWRLVSEEVLTYLLPEIWLLD